MNMDIHLGLYGKLPGYGDFVHRNLPNNFLTAWDEWLQGYIASSREKMGESWLNIYLTSPLWRFVLSAGVIDDRHWAGVVLPSVDQVGRYYPFSIAIPLPANTNPLEFMAENVAWYEHIEELALQALDNQLSLEEMIEQSHHEQYLTPLIYNKTGLPMQPGVLKIDFDTPNASINQGYAHLLDSLLSSQHQSYSVWSTSGSEKIHPCLFSVAGLPSVSQLPAMMDGHWAHWGWPQTYMINDSMREAANAINAAKRELLSPQSVSTEPEMVNNDVFNDSLLNDPLFNPSAFQQSNQHDSALNNDIQANNSNHTVQHDAFNESLLNDPMFNASLPNTMMDQEPTQTTGHHPLHNDVFIDDSLANDVMITDNLANSEGYDGFESPNSMDNVTTTSNGEAINVGTQKKNTSSGSLLDDLNIMNTGVNHHE